MMKSLMNAIAGLFNNSNGTLFMLTPAQQKTIEEINTVNKGTQILLKLRYEELRREMVQSPRPLPAFEDVEFRSYSQNGEDGILLFIFSMIGTTNKKAVEICAGNGIECNVANLIVHHGWTGLLFDGDTQNIQTGNSFYYRCANTSAYPPKLVHAWITAENINELITNNGMTGEVDLLSLDMDGMDYWVWKAINCINPRVVVLEYNNLWPADKAVTIPYKKDFKAEYSEYGVDYGGASLAAFVKLAKEKGYRYVGSQAYNFNAFFIRQDVAPDIFPEVEVVEGLKHACAVFAIQERSKRIVNREWVEV